MLNTPICFRDTDGAASPVGVPFQADVRLESRPTTARPESADQDGTYKGKVPGIRRNQRQDAPDQCQLASDGAAGAARA